MLLQSLRHKVDQSLLEFLWRQWSQIGLAGKAPSRDLWIIDPEALLAFTLQLGRYDARLFDEVVDWTVRNGRLLSIQRLKNTVDCASDEDVRRTLSAVAMIIDDHDPKPRWSRLARTRSTEEPAEPFFRDPGDQPLPVVGELDERFLSAGYLRSRVSLRGASQLVPLRPLTNLLFRLRAVFGLGPRVEVLAYLLTHPGSQSAEIARATKYSRTQVQEALSSLAQADIAVVKPRGRRRTYSVDAGRWLALLDIPGEPPRWIDWCRVFGALSKLTAFLRSIEQQPPSDYLLQSDILGLSTALSQELADTGLANPFERQLGLAESAEVFEARVRSLLDELTGREAGPRPPTPSGPAHRPRRR